MTNGVVKVSANIRRNMFAVRKFFALQAVVWLELPGRYAPLTRPKLNATVMSFLHDLSQVSHHQQTEREFKSELACNETPVATPWDEVGEATDAETAAIISKDFLVYKDFITEEEENSLFDEVEPYLKRLKYEENHWDDVSVFTILFQAFIQRNENESNAVIILSHKNYAFTSAVCVCIVSYC